MYTLGNSFLSIVSRFLATLNSPRSLTVSLLIKHGEWDQLVSLSCNPGHYDTPLRYAEAEFPTALLRKCAKLPTSFNLEEIARTAFSTAEMQCCKTNRRLEHFIRNEACPSGFNDEAIFAVIADIRKDVSGLLGDLPDDLDVKHGPGATFDDRGSSLSAIHKMQSRPTMTSMVQLLMPLWGNTAWCRGLKHSHSNRSQPKPVKGNRFTTVPKDATKDRGIAIEPSLNVAYQLAVGTIIKKKLFKWGIDLKQGQSRHRLLACDASRNDHLCTIDLSNASDTVSKNVVKLFLPDAWYELLSTLRSPSTRVDKKWFYLEKFSSMGNGFTFELETLIFASIVRACARHSGITLTSKDFGVYGDDIIIPKELTYSVLACLRYFGFTPNPKKTFVEGNFRESCGGDYFNGFNVRGHFIGEEPTDPAAWIALINGFTRIEEKLSLLGVRYNLKAVKAGCLDQLPKNIRTLQGPPELGDLVINTHELSKWTVTVRSSIRYVKVWRPVGRLHSLRCFLPGPLLAGALYGASSRGYSVRGDISGYRIGWVSFS